MNIKVKKLFPDAKLPTYGTDGAAAFDLYAYAVMDFDGAYKDDGAHYLVDSGDNILIRTGLSFEIPSGYAMFVYSRSGHGFKNSVRLINCTGVIDSDYRGELMVSLVKDEQTFMRLEIAKGDRIAQAVIMPVPKCEFTEVDELSTTERGTGGFGSTGA